MNTPGLNLSDNALKVLQRRYLVQDKVKGLVETPADLFRRVARAVSSAEVRLGNAGEAQKWEPVFFEMMSSLQFLPNSPTLMNAGIKPGQLSACFVLPVEDSMEQIFTTLKQAALIQQSGGGTGFNFSRLRPRYDDVSTATGVASGPVSFMKIFNAATDQIKQGGKRRGANIGILNIDHPDIEEFIRCKSQQDVLSSFNISVGITDKFMEVLREDGEWELKHPNYKKVTKIVAATQLWDEIIENAWQGGDPGLLFLDTINRGNPTPKLGNIEATNPCGEVPLLPYEACNLGSINLTKFVRHEKGINSIDWAGMERVIRVAVRFLDNVIEINNYLFPEIKAMVQGNRKIGLGVMGWADMLIMLEIPYESGDAVALARKLMAFINEKSLEASVELGRHRGVFPNWEQSIYYPHLPVRNATRLSIAPTGTISIIADASSSIEPLFGLAVRRQHVLDETELYSINRHFVNYLKLHQLYSGRVIDQVTREGSIENVPGLPSGAREIFKTSMQIDPEWHLAHQSSFQQYTDNAVSKTINLPETANRNEISTIYRMAWEQQLKGITIFRNHSREQQVLHTGTYTGALPCKVCLE